MTTPAYTDDHVQLHEGDCAEVLASIDQQADLAIVDPPYGDTSLPWDKLTTGWLPVVDDALKETAGLWLWGSLRYLLVAVPAASAAGWTLSQDVIWEKHNGSGSHADRFRRVHEQAVFLYRGRWADLWVEPQRSLDATARQVRRQQRPAHWGAIGEQAYATTDGGPRMMRSVMFERSAHGRSIHPTQKPLGITRTLIQYACPPRGLVVDPYAGSGTTLIAARQAGRRAIGAELDAVYVARAVDRLVQQHLALEDTR